ncbi:hypothetical protein NC652_016395 [Populus alba x Populus x berolinensis]|nr:hypothetical protein NC652_016395 [Populus alba x Populus x berolinensis]
MKKERQETQKENASKKHRDQYQHHHRLHQWKKAQSPKGKNTKTTTLRERNRIREDTAYVKQRTNII